MTRTVQVYKIMNQGTDIATLVMPVGAQFVDFAPFHGYPAIWAIVDLDNDTELRRFRMVPTGWEIPEEGKYVGSMTLIRGDQYNPMHFFEVPIPEVNDGR